MLNHRKHCILRKLFSSRIYCHNGRSTAVLAPLLQNRSRKTSAFQCFHLSTTKCIKNSDKPPPPKSAELPLVLQQQCEKWAKALRAEQKAQEGRHPWLNCSLKCTNILAGFNTSKLVLSLEELSREKRQIFLNHIKLGKPIRLRPFSGYPWKDELTGNVTKNFTHDKYCNPTPYSVIIVKRMLYRNEIEQIKNTLFDIKLETDVLYTDQMEFIKQNNEWCEMPGFHAMLYSFKCKPMPILGEIEHEFTNSDSLDASQMNALNAAMNPNRPIVAIHGPPGTGKTHDLICYLQQLRKLGKRVIVLSSSLASLYNLIGNYQQKTNDENYHILRKFDATLAAKIVADPNIRHSMMEKSFDKMPTNLQDADTRKYYKMTRILQETIEEADKEKTSGELLEVAEEYRQIGIEETHQLHDSGMKEYMEKSNKFIFTTPSRAMINMLVKNKITFDVLIVEDAAMLNEFETWRMALPLASTLRLFGDYCLNEMITRSLEARKLGFQESLMERLDKEFGSEVNVHLQRQYRSAPAIQEWPARVFYGTKSPEPDESVRNIRLNDLLVNNAQIVKYPLVLVDLSQLEGEWREHVFEPQKGGKSFYNWGEALLVAEHLRNLFDNLKEFPKNQIAYLTMFEAQRIKLQQIYDCFHNSQKLDEIRLDHSPDLQGQSCEVVLQSFVKTPGNLLSNRFHLKHLAFEMTRAKRQYMLLAKSEWLEQGSGESRQLLNTFKNYGRIIGPNDLLQLESGQFQSMQKQLAEWLKEQ